MPLVRFDPQSIASPGATVDVSCRFAGRAVSSNASCRFTERLGCIDRL